MLRLMKSDLYYIRSRRSQTWTFLLTLIFPVLALTLASWGLEAPSLFLEDQVLSLGLQRDFQNFLVSLILPSSVLILFIGSLGGILGEEVQEKTITNTLTFGYSVRQYLWSKWFLGMGLGVLGSLILWGLLSFYGTWRFGSGASVLLGQQILASFPLGVAWSSLFMLFTLYDLSSPWSFLAPLLVIIFGRLPAELLVAIIPSLQGLEELMPGDLGPGNQVTWRGLPLAPLAALVYALLILVWSEYYLKQKEW